MKDKDIFTTFETARLLNCDLTTVIKWVNENKLAAYRTPGGHRRIRKEDLIRFLKQFNMPVPEKLADAIKILIVDDDPESVELIMGYLTKLGKEHECAVAQDGFEAGRKITEFRPGLVILDVKLPGLNGYQVCENLKKDEATKSIRILAVTAYGSPEDKHKMLSLGADAYLSKPLNSDLFLKTAKKLLNIED